MAKKQLKASAKRGYGWVPDLPDVRDLTYAAPVAVAKKLPAKVDLRKKCPPVYDQGDLGSCTANAIGAAHQFDQMKQGVAGAFMPSRLFIYYNERAMEGTIDSDSGAMIRDGIKSVGKLGACPEPEWPYDVAQFQVKPSQPCYDSALERRAILYRRISRSLAQMKGCLAEGFPWVFGFTVYDSFESAEVAKSGVVPMPDSSKESVQGGHAVLAVGYDDAQRMFIVRNSWGKGWGLKGYFLMPYAYLLDDNLSDDFWTIRLVE